MHMCVNLPRVALNSVAAEIRTRDLLIASPAPYCYATELHTFLPYLTLPFGAGVLPPSAEASSGPNAHPRINPKVIETFYRFL